MSKFCQLSQELLPLIDVKSLFPLSILSISGQIFFKLCIKVDILNDFSNAYSKYFSIKRCYDEIIQV